MSVWALVAAAGRGERLGSDRPKAFIGLAGRPLLAESLERLEASPWIEQIVVAAPPGWEEPSILLAEELGCGKVVACVTGGGTRAESVRAAAAELPADAAVALVHDAARPLVSDAVIERVVTALGEGWDGAVPGLLVTDTLKRVRNGAVEETLDRSGLHAIQTPQGFVAPLLREALRGEVAGATDCSALVEARGGRVAVVEGDARLLKVTEPGDVAIIESLLR